LILLENTDWPVKKIADELDMTDNRRLLELAYNFKLRWLTDEWDWTPEHEELTGQFEEIRNRLGEPMQRELVFAPWPEDARTVGYGVQLVPLEG
jgi:hypothetical protein